MTHQVHTRTHTRKNHTHRHTHRRVLDGGQRGHVVALGAAQGRVAVLLLREVFAALAFGAGAASVAVWTRREGEGVIPENRVIPENQLFPEPDGV